MVSFFKKARYGQACFAQCRELVVVSRWHVFTVQPFLFLLIFAIRQDRNGEFQNSVIFIIISSSKMKRVIYHSSKYETAERANEKSPSFFSLPRNAWLGKIFEEIKSWKHWALVRVCFGRGSLLLEKWNNSGKHNPFDTGAVDSDKLVQRLQYRADNILECH